MFQKWTFRKLILFLIILITLLPAGCTPAPIQPTPTRTFQVEITPYRTRTPQPDIPSTPSLVRTPTPLPTPTPTPITYRVVLGDTMLGIALRYGIILEELMAANPDVDPRFLSVDTDLVIPLGEESPAAVVMPTPLPVDLGELACYPTAEGGAWCFWLVDNERSRALENLSARIRLFSADGEVQAEAVAIPPLNLVPGESALPMVAFFPPQLPDPFFPQGELLSALPVSPRDERYLGAKLDLGSVVIDPSGLQATVTGSVSLPQNSLPANLIWLAAVAYGEGGSVVGVRKWEAVVEGSALGTPPAGIAPTGTPGGLSLTPSPAGTETAAPQAAVKKTENELITFLPGALGPGETLSFEFSVFSLGPPIQDVEVLVEARP